MNTSSSNPNDLPPRQKVPWWMTALLVMTLIPCLAGPALIPFTAGHDELRVLAMFFPVYGLASTWLAWFCYRYGRVTVAWMLWALTLLSDVALAAMFNLIV